MAKPNMQSMMPQQNQMPQQGMLGGIGPSPNMMQNLFGGMPNQNTGINRMPNAQSTMGSMSSPNMMGMFGRG